MNDTTARLTKKKKKRVRNNAYKSSRLRTQFFIQQRCPQVVQSFLSISRIIFIIIYAIGILSCCWITYETYVWSIGNQFFTI